MLLSKLFINSKFIYEFESLSVSFVHTHAHTHARTHARTHTHTHTGAGEKYGLEVGDHAISEQIVPCWDCRYCKAGKHNLCTLDHTHLEHQLVNY